MVAIVIFGLPSTSEKKIHADCWGTLRELRVEFVPMAYE